MILHHISPRRNRDSIWAMGLDPMYATASPAAVYLVYTAMIRWAARHVAARHRIASNDLDVWTVVRPVVTRALPRGRVRYSPCTIPPAALRVQSWADAVRNLLEGSEDA